MKYMCHPECRGILRATHHPDCANRLPTPDEVAAELAARAVDEAWERANP